MHGCYALAAKAPPANKCEEKYRSELDRNRNRKQARATTNQVKMVVCSFEREGLH